MTIAKLPVDLTLDHTADEFWTVYHRTNCAIERRRAQYFALISEGRPEKDVLQITQFSIPGARKILRLYRAQGLDGLKDGRRHNRGAPPVLTADEQQELAARLHADFAEGIVWDGKKVQRWVKERFGKDIYLSRSYELLHRAGFSLQKPRPRHVKGDQEAQEAFKKNAD